MGRQVQINLPYQPTVGQVKSLEKEVTRLMSIYDANVVKPTNPNKLAMFRETRKTMRRFISFELRVDWYLEKKKKAVAKRVKSIEGVFDGSVYGISDFYTLMAFDDISSLQKAFSYLNHSRNVMLQAEYLPAKTSTKQIQKIEQDMADAWDIEKRNIAPTPTIAKNQKANFVADWILKLRHKETTTIPRESTEMKKARSEQIRLHKMRLFNRK